MLQIEVILIMIEAQDLKDNVHDTQTVELAKLLMVIHMPHDIIMDQEEFIVDQQRVDDYQMLQAMVLLFLLQNGVPEM
jgi:hypothetical protein